ncbi:MAG TPA: CHASE3 domain-containing protein [Casimicrobiaceae bacterium]|nr:CHASE3 domain-containing protein [Casimicrobiaceae bacterium]
MAKVVAARVVPKSRAPIVQSGRLVLPLKVVLPLVLGVVLSMAILVFSELGFRRLEAANRTMATSLEIQATLHEILGLIVDAETSQRGYLLTSQPEYLDPYRAALPRIDERFDKLRSLLARQPAAEQVDRVNRFNQLTGKKLAELEATLALYEKGGRDAAFALISTGMGQRLMEQIRDVVASMSGDHSVSVSAEAARWIRDVDFARLGMQIMTGFTIALLLIVWVLLRRDMLQREEKRRQLMAEQQRLETEVERRTSELSELSNHLQTVREEEKTRLARDIHDELGGVLVSAKMDVSWVEEHLAKGTAEPEVASKLQRAQDSLDQGVALKRRIIEELRPSLLDNLGLGAAIEWYAHQMCDRAGIELQIDVPADPPKLLPSTAIGLFRIVQEALTNVVRYAKAKKVEIELVHSSDSVSLVISDDGIGIPEGAQNNRLSHGINGMRHRVRALRGEFSIHGTPGRGTMIEVTLPMESNATEAAMPVDFVDSARPTPHVNV